MTPTDLAEMPGFNPNVPNGQRSVSEGRVRMDTGILDDHINMFFQPGKRYPYCARHGAMLRVSKEGIWRCGELGCDTGCWYPS